MPTVGRFEGFRVVIYPNDHRPAHVHVVGGGIEAVFDLRCPDGPPVLRESYGPAEPRIGRVMDEVARSLRELCGAWEAIHGAW